MTQGKIPPYSKEAEQSILGSLLIDSERMIQVSDVLLSEDFYEPNHALIFQSMLDLFTKNRPIDLLTVREVLDDRKQLDSIGGHVYLAELTNVVPSSANITQYAEIVKNKSVLRKLIRSGTNILGMGYQEDANLNDLLEKSEQELFGVTQTFIKDKLVHIRDILSGRHEEYSEIHENPDAIDALRVKTWFWTLDNKLQGLRGGDMVILAARPSMGKTALALNVAQNVGYKKKNVAIFSLEMSREQLVDRMLCAAMGVDSWKLQKWALSDDEFARIGDAMERLHEANIYIDDSAAMTLLEIKSKCRRLKMESGVDLIIIDYLQLIHGTNPANRVQEISAISQGIKALARELDVPVIALSQLSRAVESRATKEPILSDLRESGSIEQDADIVLMMYREDYYIDMDMNDINKGLTHIFIRKNRNGPVGQIELKFDNKFMKFREVDNQHREMGGF